MVKFSPLAIKIFVFIAIALTAHARVFAFECLYGSSLKSIESSFSEIALFISGFEDSSQLDVIKQLSDDSSFDFMSVDKEEMTAHREMDVPVLFSLKKKEILYPEQPMKNPHYDIEQQLLKRWAAQSVKYRDRTLSEISAVDEVKDNDVIIVGDDYLNKSESSDEFRKAKEELTWFFQNSWSGKMKERPEIEDPYMKILQAAKQMKIRVIAMDAKSEYVFQNFVSAALGGVPFVSGVAVRNMLWAQVIPLEGTGLVYGGAAHFAVPKELKNEQRLALDSIDYLFSDFLPKRSGRLLAWKVSSPQYWIDWRIESQTDANDQKQSETKEQSR